MNDLVGEIAISLISYDAYIRMIKFKIRIPRFCMARFFSYYTSRVVSRCSAIFGPYGQLNGRSPLQSRAVYTSLP